MSQEPAIHGNLITQLIRGVLTDAEVEVEDIAGDGRHWSVTVKSAAFRGKTRVQQHRMIYGALENQFDGALHALAIQTEEL